MNKNIVDHSHKPPLLDPEQAATFLQLSSRTLAKWRSIGRGPAYVKVGRLPRYRQSDLDNYLSRHTVNEVA